jgi:serine/threonine protein phosphatase PrpC
VAAGPPAVDVPTPDTAATGSSPTPPAVTDGTRELTTSAPVIGNSRPVASGGARPGHPARVPDVVLDGLAAWPYDIAAASVIGTAHVAGGSTRQDAYAFGLDPSGRLCVAVADGLGSRPASQLGARAFCEEVVRCTMAGADRDTNIQELMTSAARRVAAMVVDAYAVAARDAACVGVVGLFEGARCVLGRVGDCSAFVLRDGEFEELFADGPGYVNHVTATLVAEEVQNVDTATVTDADMVVLVSDGLANDIRTSAAVRAWLADQWRRPVGPFAAGDALRYRRQGSHDDRTAVAVWVRRP